MKITTASTRMTFALIASMALVFSIASLSVSANEGETAGCQVSLEPQTVQAGAVDIAVIATPSEPIGTLVSAEIDGKSAADVAVIDTERRPEGFYALALDLSAAEAGDWNVTLNGAHGECTGTLRVESQATK